MPKSRAIRDIDYTVPPITKREPKHPEPPPRPALSSIQHVPPPNAAKGELSPSAQLMPQCPMCGAPMAIRLISRVPPIRTMRCRNKTCRLEYDSVRAYLGGKAPYSVILTDKGVAKTETTGSTLTLAGVSISRGASIIVANAYQSLGADDLTISFGGQNLTQSGAQGTGSGNLHSVHVVHNPSSSSGNVVLSVTAAGFGAASFAVLQVEGLQSGSHDVAVSTSTTSDPIDHASATTTYVQDFLYQYVGADNGGSGFLGSCRS